MNQSVLIVCTGNLNQSPLLAGLLQKARPLWHVESCGTSHYTRLRAPASLKTRELALELYDIDLSVHRTKHISELAWSQWGYIIYFSKAQRYEITRAFPKMPEDAVLRFRLPNPGFMRRRSPELSAVIERAGSLVADFLVSI